METSNLPNFSSFVTSPLFSGLNGECLECLYNRGTLVELAAGETLIDEGKPNESLYFVLSGLLWVILPKHGGRLTEVRLGGLEPGDCIGEYSLLDHQPASATVVAVNPATVLKFSASELEELLAANPVVGLKVYRNLLSLLIGRLRAKDADLDLFQPAWQNADESAETAGCLARIY